MTYQDNLSFIQAIFKPYPTSGSETSSGLLDALEKSRVVLQPIIEPFILGFKPDQHACRFSVPRDHDFFFFSES